ncbi:hypothetical protein OS493_026143 [Desmophyllum pertusum]|uniref:Uncharacterized protein n=1 Tax=Desmophyllum pertusum TaxID=174260 RepID=A0A9X0D970_9CNID|nr:hypothetical protein OS493_026143 [Desmophyllum pertusum]
MKANLEMNKEALAADLVCMLDERSLPRDKAQLEQQIANFFIVGATRIDLIAKIVDLDNDIGGFNFDIDNLEKTANEIESLRSSPDSPIANDIQQSFLDDLLESYRQMETRFARKLYKFYKAFEFQSLWNLDSKMAQYQQVASSAAEGTGRLQGVLELTKALQDINDIESKARTRCFTKFHHTTDTHKWSFDSVKDGVFFDELHEGQTRFTIKIADTSGTSYNIRLLKMYVELYGDDSQGEGFPAKVYLNLRHMAASYFRDESDTVKEFRQPLGSTRKFQYNRFAITDETKCKEELKKGNGECPCWSLCYVVYSTV